MNGRYLCPSRHFHCRHVVVGLSLIHISAHSTSPQPVAAVPWREAGRVVDSTGSRADVFKRRERPERGGIPPYRPQLKKSLSTVKDIAGSLPEPRKRLPPARSDGLADLASQSILPVLAPARRAPPPRPTGAVTLEAVGGVAEERLAGCAMGSPAVPVEVAVAWGSTGRPATLHTHELA